MNEPLALLLLAAGHSRRFGADKLNQQIDGQTLLQHSYQVLSASCDAPIFVARQAGTAPLPWLPSAHQLNCKTAYQGLGYTISEAISRLTTMGYTRVLLSLADQVALTTSDHQQLVARHQQLGASVASSYDDVVGVPALICGEQLQALKGLAGDRGAQAMLQSLPIQQRLANPNAAIDIDTPSDLHRYLQQRQSSKQTHSTE
ncbi:nucleotidyltransferase family protein [Ferrimonas senticii]|uniref:nucleotidyltransferase family protein n=1 Tax=Ferrimonas senticii TaxID=394566 RepID=UPI0003FCFA28|nr:nucleotidyltransferase family protein [Ferrimonas senticii]